MPQKNKCIIFICYPNESTGDTTFFIQMAKQLTDSNSNITCVFVLSELGATILKNSNFKVFQLKKGKGNEELLDNLFQKYNPSLMILSSIPAIPYTEKDLFSIKFKEFFELTHVLIEKYKIPLIGIVDRPFYAPRNKQELYNIRRFFPKSLKLLYPCPHITPHYKDDSIIYWRPYTKSIENHVYKENLRKELKCNKNDRIIFFSVPPWVYKIPNITPQYYRLMRDILIYYFSKFQGRIHMISIEAKVIETDYIEFPNSKDRIYHYKTLDIDEYDRLLLGSDLILSDYYFQASFIKAWASYIPGVILQNNTLIHENIDKNIKEDKLRNIFIKMKKVYNKDFLIDLQTGFNNIKNEDFFKTLLNVEIFNMDNTINTLQNILYNDDFKKEITEKQKKLEKKLKSLPDLSTILF